MIPFAIDVPPPVYPLAREERRIEFDPDPVADPFSYFPEEISYTRNRLSTSNTPNRTVVAVRSFGARWQPQTSAHALDRTLAAPKADDFSAPGQLAEIKRLTGYNWEQLATILGCTRQAIHKWNSGDPIANVNRDRLAKLHATIQYFDRGNADDNRSLLYKHHDGSTISEMLAHGRFDEVKAIVGRGTGRPDAKWGKIDKETVAPQDHWYPRLVDSDEFDDEPNIGRSEPQTLRRLQLRKG